MATALDRSLTVSVLPVPEEEEGWEGDVINVLLVVVVVIKSLA